MESRTIYRYTLNRVKVGGVADGLVASSPAEIVKFLRALRLHEEEQECLVTVVLDARSNIKGYHPVTRGLVDRAMAHAREVFRYAIINNAGSVVIAHNHPSGDPAPSAMDIAITEGLKRSGKIIGIELIDHVILGEKGYHSFAETNML